MENALACQYFYETPTIQNIDEEIKYSCLKWFELLSEREYKIGGRMAGCILSKNAFIFCSFVKSKSINALCLLKTCRKGNFR